MTEQIFVMVAEMQAMLDLIQKLEERIIALERKESVLRILPTDNYYWEHG